MGKNVETKMAKTDMTDLMAVLMRIEGRLDALEKKTDLVVSRTAARSFGGREQPNPVHQPYVASQTFHQSAPPQQRLTEVKPVQVQGRPSGRPRERRERILHKAVCADCQKDCEIPFKPTGERPVYCKECFSKRKTGNSSKEIGENRLAPDFSSVPAEEDPPQRKVIVTKKGVGKVTISEVVRSSANDKSQKAGSADKKKR